MHYLQLSVIVTPGNTPRALVVVQLFGWLTNLVDEISAELGRVCRYGQADEDLPCFAPSVGLRNSMEYCVLQQTVRHSHPVDHNALREFGTRLFVAAGLIEADARLVTDTLVMSSLRGIDSHGVARIPHYLRRIRMGSIKPRPRITTQALSASTARIDGDHGLGQLVMHRATETAVQLAKDTGAGWVSVSDSSHCGALAYYGLKIADAGMIGIVFTHVDPMVIPYGARKPFCGTNPICITAPRASQGAALHDTGAICLDMATSKIPWNIVMNAAIEKVPIELGWGVDKEGNNTTRPEDVVGLYPFGDYKGSGLGLMIDVFCSLLSDAPYGPDIPVMYGDLNQRRHLGGLVGAIDISRFVPIERFHARTRELLERWNAQTPCKEGERVLFPGEPELIEQQSRLRKGIPIGQHVLCELDEAADSYGVDRLPRLSLKPAHSAPHTSLSRYSKGIEAISEP